MQIDEITDFSQCSQLLVFVRYVQGIPIFLATYLNNKGHRHLRIGDQFL